MNRRDRTTGFALSILMHGTLLVMLLWYYPQQDQQVSAALPLKLDLHAFVTHTPVQQQVVEPEPVPEPEPIQEPEPEPEPEPIPEPEPQAVKKVQPKPPPKKKVKKIRKAPPPPALTAAPKQPQPAMATPVEGPQVDAERIERIRSAYTQSLVALIEQSKFYPKRARRRHQEGVVKISFVIMRDGAIRDLALVSSSGYSVLDKAALEALRRVGRFQPIPDELGIDDWKIDLPLEYRLL